jgi:hypothetical protein
MKGEITGPVEHSLSLKSYPVNKNSPLVLALLSNYLFSFFYKNLDKSVNYYLVFLFIDLTFSLSDGSPILFAELSETLINSESISLIISSVFYRIILILQVVLHGLSKKSILSKNYYTSSVISFNFYFKKN